MTMGLQTRYFGLRRTRDGSEVEGWYFVLREDDPHAKAALLAYANSCEPDYPELAADLRAKLEASPDAACGASALRSGEETPMTDYERCDGRHLGGDSCTSEIGHDGPCTFGMGARPKRRANRDIAADLAKDRRLTLDEAAERLSRG